MEIGAEISKNIRVSIVRIRNVVFPSGFVAKISLAKTLLASLVSLAEWVHGVYLQGRDNDYNIT